MARKLIVEVAADISQLVKGLRAGEHATSTFAKEVTVDSRAMAKAQVDAAIKTTAALEKEAAAYRAIAHTAEKGSKEQVVAARLAAQADEKLAREIGQVGHAASRAHGSMRSLERDMGHATRGALSGSHAFGGFGRSLAFASGGFIAFHSATDFLRESVDAAREAIVAQRSLAAQMKASGESFSQNREKIEAAALSYGKFGFQNDEVIASLTVLERGTGNINKAIELQGLTADLARAKNLDLSKAANIVAKVFGGQETALRRAVPGLAKHAHGMDLIRLAQAKLAGQAAANTTAADRFHAVLHDTQEIVGSALLPTLNRYLNSLAKWLDEMNRSGRLQADVAKTARFLADAVAAIKAVTEPLVIAFRALADAVGGNKRALEILLGAYVTFKGMKIAASVLDTAASFGKVAVEAEGAAGKVALLNSKLLRLVANPYTVAIVLTFIGAEYVAKKVKDLQEMVIKAQQQTFKRGSGLETTLVPNLARQIDAMKKSGESGAQIIAALRKKLGGSLKADDLIAEAFAFSSGSDPKMQARIRAQVAKRAHEATNTAKDELDKQARSVTVEQRNTWFDQMIDRLLGGVEATPTGAPAGLQTQLTRLRHVAAVLTKQIAATKDITRQLKLKARLQEVLNQEWQKQQEIAQASADAAEAAKEKQQEAVDKMIAALEVNVARAGLTKSLTDDIAAQKVLIEKLREQVRATHGSSEAWQALIAAQGQLNEFEQQAAQQRADARAARQFRALGLGPGGEEPVPGVAALRKQLASLKQRLAGTGIASGRMIEQIGKVLAGKWGTVGQDVRQKIAEIMAGWRNELEQGGDKIRLVKFRPIDTTNFLKSLGLNLSPDQLRRVQAGLSTYGPNMTVARPTGQFALAGGVTIGGDVHLHGVTNMRQFENELQKRAQARPHRRRGAR